jgi:hypothetical protein
MSIRIVSTDLHILNMRTRIPFRYGITTLTACPHLLCRVQLDVDGTRASGISADHLPPKWFTKNPATPFAADVADMLEVITHACGLARGAAAVETVFDLWERMYHAQAEWGETRSFPPLLSGFGPSLVERAAIEAFCRAAGVTFGDAVRRNLLGVRLGSMHPELRGAHPSDLLPERPLRSIVARHTVGLIDPLVDADIPPADRVTDGLPQSLESCIRAYDLTHFKIKLSGDVGQDRDRLARLADLLDRNVPGRAYAFTLDGNENFHELEPFRSLWGSLATDLSLAPFLSRLIFVEQPLHRDVALLPATTAALNTWSDRPPLIIDESDATIDSVRTALDGGYVGTSHKNCKNVFKGAANACLIEHRRREHDGVAFVLSGEDLSNVGPIALLQDLAAVATFGIHHVERNGHHYFPGLSQWPADVQRATLEKHDDLYHPAPRGWPTLKIERGAVAVGSVVEAPFGVGFEVDPTPFIHADRWTIESLG